LPPGRSSTETEKDDDEGNLNDHHDEAPPTVDNQTSS
jgi:hypothetical protein